MVDARTLVEIDSYWRSEIRESIFTFLDGLPTFDEQFEAELKYMLLIRLLDAVDARYVEKIRASAAKRDNAEAAKRDNIEPDKQEPND